MSKEIASCWAITFWNEWRRLLIWKLTKGSFGHCRLCYIRLGSVFICNGLKYSCGCSEFSAGVCLFQEKTFHLGWESTYWDKRSSINSKSTVSTLLSRKLAYLSTSDVTVEGSVIHKPIFLLNMSHLYLQLDFKTIIWEIQ